LNLKLLVIKISAFGHNFLLNYAGFLCFTFLIASFLSFKSFYNRNIDLGYYTLLIVPIFFSFAFIIQLFLFVKNKITLEGYVFSGLMKQLHAGRYKSFFDNIIPIFLMISMSFAYCYMVLTIPDVVYAFNFIYFETDGNSFTTGPFFFCTIFSLFTGFCAFIILRESQRLLTSSIALKNQYCLKNKISNNDRQRIMFTIYNGEVLKILLDDLIVNVKKNIAIYKNKKYKHTALLTYLDETGLTIKELSPYDWEVVSFMSI
jgi:hypothetical protein